MYKNIEKQTKLQLKDQIDYQPGQDTPLQLSHLQNHVKRAFWHFHSVKQVFYHPQH